VQVDVDDVEAHVARPGDPADGVQVRAVVVHERACVVEDACDLGDVLVEEPERGRVRQHQRRRRLVHLPAQVLDVDVAAGVGLHGRQLVAGHRHGGGIRTVRGVRDHDLAPLRALAPFSEIRAHEHQARQLALRARRRLERDRVEPGHLREDLLEPPHQLERAPCSVLFL
jgi:hypothetical protein